MKLLTLFRLVFNLKQNSYFFILLSLIGISIPKTGLYASEPCSAEDVAIHPNAQSLNNQPLDSAANTIDNIKVLSDSTELIHNQSTEFFGQVEISKKGLVVGADHAIYNAKDQTFDANGDVYLISEQALISGSNIRLDEKNKEFEINNSEYQLRFSTVRGQAESFKIGTDSLLQLNGATFTTCPEASPSWLFNSQSISINETTGWGQAWHSIFRIKDVPVFYLPYIAFPVTDSRQTGLLFPDFGSSDQYGQYYSQSLYLNIAENIDATLTPSIMSKRGTLLRTNGRYLSQRSYNILQFDYLNEDKQTPTLDERYMGYLQHQSDWSKHWNVQIQWTELSDDDYINEFDSDYHHSADTYLNNFVRINYLTQALEFSLLTQDINELSANQSAYDLPLQIDINWNAYQFSDHFNLNMYSLYSQFENNSKAIDKVNRAHFEPSLIYQYRLPGFHFLGSASYLSTHYEQHNQTTDKETNYSRNINKYRVLTGLIFEKPTHYFSRSVRQTLEPKIQYLYIGTPSNEDKLSNIDLYDTQRLKEDYYSLFRDRNNSSIDRITATNQATVGVSTSLFDNKNQEILRLELGQIHVFNANDNRKDEKPSFAFEWFAKLGSKWQFNGGLLYSRELNKVESGFSSLDYWHSESKNIQINHRYALDVTGVTINQTGLFTQYKVSPSWSLSSSYHYDNEREKTLDALIGVQYQSCCWSVQLSAQRKVLTNLDQFDNNNLKQPEYDNSIELSFSLSGLGSSSNAQQPLSSSIFSYRRPYLISN